MSNIADKLNALVSAKNDIKTALESKGVSPTGGLSTYADAIREISNSGGTEPLSKWVNGWKLGYSSFVEAPMLDTSEMTDMSYMFYKCPNLTSVPLFDTSKVTDMNYMFGYCINLTSVPQLDTSKCEIMSNMFYNCHKLTTVPLLDATHVIEMYSIFEECGKLTNIGGFKNLGRESLLSTSWAFTGCPNITKESVLNIFNNLYDRASAGYTVKELKFEKTVEEKLTYSDIAIATNKGWTIGFYS